MSQLRYLTRRKIKPDYVGAINAQTQYLPDMYEAKETQQYNTEMGALRQKGLDENIAYQDRMAGIAESQADIAERDLTSSIASRQRQADISKKSAKTAENLGWANLGVTALTGLAKYGSQPGTADTPGVISSIGTGAKKLYGDVAGGVSDLWDWAGGLFNL